MLKSSSRKKGKATIASRERLCPDLMKMLSSLAIEHENPQYLLRQKTVLTCFQPRSLFEARRLRLTKAKRDRAGSFVEPGRDKTENNRMEIESWKCATSWENFEHVSQLFSPLFLIPQSRTLLLSSLGALRFTLKAQKFMIWTHNFKRIWKSYLVTCSFKDLIYADVLWNQRTLFLLRRNNATAFLNLFHEAKER